MYKTSKIVISPRVRKSPYFDSTMKYGATAFTVYNHMYLPIVFEGPEEDYENLLKGVQLWDVGVERQVEIKGPEASKLAPLAYSEIIMNVIIGYYFFGDFPNQWIWIGLTIIVASGVYISLREAKK